MAQPIIFDAGADQMPKSWQCDGMAAVWDF